MTNLKLRRFNTSLKDLKKVIEDYMINDVDGDDFENSLEQGFENAVRKLLKSKGFDIIDKKNVKNTIAIAEEKEFADIDHQIPDGGIICSDGLALIEIKYCRDEKAYKADRDKVSGYLTQGKCQASGVLFLDIKQYPEWIICEKNPKYFFEWRYVNLVD